MHKETLKLLISEAHDNYHDAQTEFEETDCVESMYAADSWEMVLGWLNSKIGELEGK